MNRKEQGPLMKLDAARFGLAVALMLTCAGCSSLPKAPTVSESHRRPVNSTEAVELQSCRGQLKNTEVLLQETAKLATSASSALANTAARCAAPRPSSDANPIGPAASISSAPESSAPAANKVYVLLFPFGSTQLDLLDEDAMALAAAAANAQLIEIRGRTDGSLDSAGNQRVARGRAEAVRDYLASMGIAPERIRVTYQAVGDHVADNQQDDGRAMNRRAEVEIYAAVPRREVLASRSTLAKPEGGSYASR
jgi:outer membrane protein OmpA-like peptidoglycan-associated protein